jgi:type IV pilus assembly protein PilA
MKKLFSPFFRNQKGFTLIEVLVVISILGILAGVAVPNIAGLIGTSKTSVKPGELVEVQNCVVAAMADEKLGTIATAGTSFGNTGHDSQPTATDITIGTKQLSSYIVGGMVRVLGEYRFDADGTVHQLWYP